MTVFPIQSSLRNSFKPHFINPFFLKRIFKNRPKSQLIHKTITPHVATGIGGYFQLATYGELFLQEQRASFDEIIAELERPPNLLITIMLEAAADRGFGNGRVSSP